MTNRISFSLLFLTILSFCIGILNLNILKGIIDISKFNEPPYISYPYLNIIWKATDLSFTSMSFPKMALDKLIFIWPFFGIFFLLNLLKNKRVKFKSKFSIYIIFSFIISTFYIFDFLTHNNISHPLFKIVLNIIMIPAVLFTYFFVYGFLYSRFTSQKFEIFECLDTLRLSYGKMFIFVYLLGMGTDAIPIDEMGLYTNKFGEDRAWQIVTFRNWIFDIMFFSLMYLYPLILTTDKNISIKDSFQKVSEIFKSNKLTIFKLGFFYYLFNLVSVFLLHRFLTDYQFIDYAFKFSAGFILFLATNYFMIKLLFINSTNSRR